MDSYERLLNRIAAQCTDCGICQRECELLRRFGTPRSIADRLISDKSSSRIGFLCNLCGLCAVVCPKGLDPSLLFLESRRYLVAHNPEILKPFGPLRRFETLGKGRLFSYFRVKPGTRRIFFPGCSLPGKRPDLVIKAYEFLKSFDPALGIVLDCCSKPSHDLGDSGTFFTRFQRLCHRLEHAGIGEVIVACPNCYRVFEGYGDTLKVKTIYEIIVENAHLEPINSKINMSDSPFVTVHDPCSIRPYEHIHSAVRSILSGLGFRVVEMQHSHNKTFCCGEGGAVRFIDKGLSALWKEKRKKEAQERPIVTYCAGCLSILGQDLRVYHVLDLYFSPRKGLDHHGKRPPHGLKTYLNRLYLKALFTLGLPWSPKEG